MDVRVLIKEVTTNGLQFVPIDDTETENSITYIQKNKKIPTIEECQNKIEQSKASIVVVDEQFRGVKSSKKIIYHPTPKTFFVSLIKEIEIEHEEFISPTAVIEDGATIGKGCYIGANVYIHKNTKIGNNVSIMPNTTVGVDGFGHVVNNKKEQVYFPHIGGVIIEDNVRIGACTCICRGTLGNTLIKKGARIDNLVHIAHNVTIGQNSCIVANCMIAGSVTIGDNTWVGPSSSVLNQLSVGEGVMIGMASCVVKDIVSNKLVYGHPAKEK